MFYHSFLVFGQVQIKALDMISGLQTKDYLGKLEELNLWSLQKRIMFDLLKAYKIILGIGNIVTLNWLYKELKISEQQGHKQMSSTLPKKDVDLIAENISLQTE